MKLKILIFVFFNSFLIIAQVPQMFNYQIALLDNGNILLVNHSVNLRISILQTTDTGTALYVETQTKTTTENGIANILIGNGTIILGQINTIDWETNIHFIKTEVDINNDGIFDIVKTNQIYSVPYALVAQTKIIPTYQINTYYANLGGYVIDISPDGKHGVVASMRDQSTNDQWFTADARVADATNHDLVGQNFRDWRLPSKYELNLMYQDRVALNMTSNIYWAYSRADNDNSWAQNFSDGTQFIQNNRVRSYIRCVRRF